MAKVPNDYELDFLKNCTKEELAPLVGIILGTDKDKNIDKSGRISSELDSTPAFTKHFPDHTRYVDEIIEEIQKYGGSSIRNLMRGYGVSYHEVLCDVAKKLKVNFNDAQNTKMIEEELLAKVLVDAWEKMTEEERQELLEDSGDVIGKHGGLNYAVAIGIFRMGGFNAYIWAYRLVSVIAKAVLGHGFRPIVMAGIGKWLAILAGPVGWIIAGGWMLVDITGTAYRVTIPACIYLAALREVKENEESARQDKENA